MLAEDVDGTTKDARALYGGHRRPYLLPLDDALRGLFGVFPGSPPDLGEHLAISQVDGLEGDATADLHVMTANIKPLFFESGRAVILFYRYRRHKAAPRGSLSLSRLFCQLLVEVVASDVQGLVDIEGVAG